MSAVETRVALAHQWFVNTQSRAGDGYGWGWVLDVPPNPQNTAEVVCALTEAGLAVPNESGVERLIRTYVVESPRGDWTFREAIDTSWRIRALRRLGVPADDPDLVAGVDALLSMQLPTGGWPMAAREGSASATATSGAVLALVESDNDSDRDSGIRAAVLLARQMTRDHSGFGQPYAAAHAAYALSHPRVSRLAGRRATQALTVACDRLMEYLSRRRYEVEEESFWREGVADTWRHLTLPLALRALATARPDVMFDPAFRDGLVALLTLQDTAPGRVNRGGFRTSPEGFVTSYATTQALEVITAARHAFDEHVSPAVLFDLISQRSGAHHTDPQTVVSVGRQSVSMNSTAGLAVMCVSVFAGIALTVAAVLLEEAIRTNLSRVFLVIGSLLAGLGVSSYLSTRLHRTPGRRVALVSFTLFTALVLPVLTFVLE